MSLLLYGWRPDVYPNRHYGYWQTPDHYKLVAPDISDSSAYYNRAAFPPNGVIWNPPA